MKIITIPHPVLRQKTKTVQKIDKKIQKLVHEMEKTLDAQRDPEGVGLSAPQVGYLLSLFIITHPKTKERYTFINPEIVKQEAFMQKDAEEENLEGCLSIPGIWAPVQRYNQIQVKYLDIQGKEHLEWFDDFLAVVVQHEMDHLEGILFTQRAVEQGNPIYKEINGKLQAIDYV
jgi:peptide deformylase